MDASRSHRSFGVAREYSLEFVDIKPRPIAAAVHRDSLAGTQITNLNACSMVWIMVAI